MFFVGLISKNKSIEFIKDLEQLEDVQVVNINNKKIDILVIEDLKIQHQELEELIKNVQYLIIQDNITNVQLNLYKEINIITFGFNHKSTVTVSSVTDEEIAVCIQRNIKSINNKLIQPKEKIVKNTNKYNINKHIIKKIIEEIIEK